VLRHRSQFGKLFHSMWSVFGHPWLCKRRLPTCRTRPGHMAFRGAD
jgi:hypothetical protein